MKVSNNRCAFNKGILTAWHPEVQVQRQYYGFPDDAYELAVDDIKQRGCGEFIHLQMNRD